MALLKFGAHFSALIRQLRSIAVEVEVAEVEVFAGVDLDGWIHSVQGQ